MGSKSNKCSHSNVLQTQVKETLSQIDFTGLTGKLLTITRSGQGVTLVNPSLFEPDTTFKCLNELLLLLTLPGLDSLFQDPLNGKLKKEMVYIVDKAGQTKFTVYHHKIFYFACGRAVIIQISY